MNWWAIAGAVELLALLVASIVGGLEQDGGLFLGTFVSISLLIWGLVGICALTAIGLL